MVSCLRSKQQHYVEYSSSSNFDDNNDEKICLGSRSENGSISSSYADLIESSGVVIRDFVGSFSREPTSFTHVVTYNLNKCKTNVVIPYYKLLCLISWRPFGKELKSAHGCVSLLNYFYTLLCFCILLFWYCIRVYTCQGKLEVASIISPAKPITTPAPTINPNVSVWNWSSLEPSQRLEMNVTFDQDYSFTCEHVFGTYIVPSFLHFLAFLAGFYHFRVQEHEGLYALMEKVYLQSHAPSKITKYLRIYLLVGALWLLYVTGTLILYFFAFGFEFTTGINPTIPKLKYILAVLIIFSGVFASCVNLAVVLSYCGQCQLLHHYIDGVCQRLEEKSTDLKAAMKDVLDIKRHFGHLNGLLSITMSCIVFNLMLVLLATAVILLFHYRELSLIVFIYRLMTAVQYGSIFLFVLVQAARLTSRENILREKALAIRVFGYQSHTQADIDSFLHFISMIKLEAQIFMIPVKSRYLWGVLIVSVQILILLFQAGGVASESKWL